MWLAALYMMTQMADKLNFSDDKIRYKELLLKAKDAYIKKLWNGKNIFWILLANR